MDQSANDSTLEQTREVLEREVEISTSVAELASRLLCSHSIEDISDLVLDLARRLTSSAIGFVGYIDPESGYLVSPTLTRHVWEACQVEDKDIVFSEFRGLWGWVLENRRPLVSNSVADDPRSTGTPAGHLRVHKFLSTPALEGETLVGQVAVANPRRDYDEHDVQLVKRLADLYALAVQRQRVEQLLHKSRANWQATFEAAPVAMLVLDENLQVVQLNDAVERMFSVQKAEAENRAIGRGLNCIHCLRGPETCGQGPHCRTCSIRTTVAEVASSGEPERDREVLKRFMVGEEQRELWLSISAQPVIIDDRKHTLLTLEDITERKRVEQMKNEFISVVSHELRTPVTSIMGSLALLRGGAAGELPGQATNLIDIAHRNSKRLVGLVNDILDIEKIESGKMVFHMGPLQIMPVVEQAIEANRFFGEQFDVSFAVVSRLPGDVMVKADGERLTQVITNLLSNAAKFSSPHETVEVAVSRHGDAVRVSVTDYGPGIPEAFRPKVFDKFVQADASDTRKKGGSGLGLSISKAIIERMKGRIGFTTEEGVGTTFYFDLPKWH